MLVLIFGRVGVIIWIVVVNENLVEFVEYFTS